MVRVLVTGGRIFTGRTELFHALDSIHRKQGISLLIEGGALGADRIAREWAIINDVDFVTERAHWDSLNHNPGRHRNKLMLDKWLPELVLATKGGVGTANMIIQSARRNIKVLRTWRDF